MKYYTTRDSNETKQKGSEFAANLRGGEVLCLYGDLGSGKTVFVSGIINFFLKEKRVLSPTFTIVRHYPVQSRKITDIYHADLYRITNENEIIGLGLTEIFGKKGVFLAIEWAQNLGKFIPDRRINITFKIINGNEREIKEEWIR